MTKETTYCDRCKMEIKYPIIKPLHIGKYRLFYTSNGGWTTDDYDLCQDCCNSLREWFENKEETKR